MSLCFRALVEEMLRETTEDLINQRSTVDGAFSQRCQELLEAKTELQMKLTQVKGGKHVALGNNGFRLSPCGVNRSCSRLENRKRT